MPTPFVAPPEQNRLPDAYRPEAGVVQALADRVGGALAWDGVIAMAGPWVEQVRRNPAPFWAMESLLREYPITSAEGLALMRLAEALLRVPDAPTAIALTADQLGRADFDGASEGSPHKMLAALSASAISMSKRFLPGAEDEGGLFKRLGAQTVVAATVRAIQLLGRQFVLGQDIGAALDEARAQRRAEPAGREPLVFSFDMLGEGARCDEDARRYLAAYAHAIEAIAQRQPAGAVGRRCHIASRACNCAAGAEDEPGMRALIGNDKYPRFPRLLDPELRIADMARSGVDLQVIMVNSPGVQIFEAGEASELARLINDRAHEWTRRWPDKFVALAAVAPRGAAD